MRLPDWFELGEFDPFEDPNERYWPLLLVLGEAERFPNVELPLEYDPDGRSTLLRAPELLLKLPFAPREVFDSEKLCHPFWF